MYDLPLLLAQTAEDTTEACGPPEDASWLCEVVHEVTDRPGLARAADVLVAKPAAVLFIVLVAFVVNRLARRGIRRVVRRLKDGLPQSRWTAVSGGTPAGTATTPGGPAGDLAAPGVAPGAGAAVRRSQRAEAIGTLMRSMVSVVIWVVAGLMALGELGLNLGPLLAGAGVVGIALGFGAQSLVKDFLSGIFMLVEDQFGVGDVIDAGEATGTVESVSLRTTRLRSVEGVVWHIPNGEIRRIGNQSQEWSRALIDVPVAYQADLAAAAELILKVSGELAAEPGWAERILKPPEVWGVERFDADSVAIRTVITTTPNEQWNVSRELRQRLKAAFDQAGLEIPFPQRTIWVRHENGAGGDPGI